MDYCHKIDAVLDKIGIRIYKNDDENDANMDVDTATDLESTENDNQSNAD